MILHLRDRPFASLACFALAMLSKESAVAFFPLVLLGDYAIGKWKSRLQYALEGGLTLLYLGLLWKIQGGRFGQTGISLEDNPLASLPGRMENSERSARGVEIHRPANLSGCALQRLLLQPNSDVPGLAPHAPRGDCGRRSRLRLDLGGTQTAGGSTLAGVYLFRGLCDYGEYPGSHRNDHGRAARLSSVRGILPLVGAWLELASAKEANSGLGIARHDCIYFFRTDGGTESGV